jgi:hypothetical protein
MNLLDRVKRLALWEGGLPPLWLALVAVQLVPIFNNRLLPMLEAPRDLALARVWHSARAEDWHVGDYYSPIYRLWPGTLIYYLLDLFLYAMPIEAAHKLLLSLYVVLFPLSIAVLARALGRSAWLAILAFPLVYNRTFMFGYSGVLLGASLTFLALAALITSLDRRRVTIPLIFLSVLAFLANLQTAAVFVLAAAGLIWLAHRRGTPLRGTLFALGPMLALLVAFGLDAGSERFLGGDDWVATFKDLPALVIDFPKRVLDVMVGTIDMNLLGLLAITWLVLCVWKGVRDPQSWPRLGIILLAFFAGYSLLPWELKEPFAEPAYAPRLAPFLAAALLLLPRRPLAGAQRLVLIPVLAAAVYLPLKLNRFYRDFSRRNSGYLRLAHELPRGATTLTLIAGMRYSRDSIDFATDVAATGAVYWHWGAWPLALNGGYAPYVLDRSPLVRVDKQLKAPKPPAPDRVPLRQVPFFDYYFTRGIAEAFDREPALHIVDQLADWTLLKRVYELSDEP